MIMLRGFVIMRRILKVISILILVLVLTFQGFQSSFVLAESQTTMNAQSSNNEVVLLIPGIMGVELYREYYSDYLDMYLESLVWASASRSARNELNFDLNPILIPKLPLGWEGSRSDAEWSGLFNMYGNFETFFKDKGYKVHYFSYDWRKSSIDLVSQLSDRIEEIKGIENVSKVNIVGHSMGGVLGKKYILETEGKSVNKFITLGAPFFGAPEAVKRLKDGYLFKEIVTISSAEVNQTIPAVYELAPVNKSYFHHNNNSGYIKNMTYDWSKPFDGVTMPERITRDISFSHSNEILGKMFRKEYVDQAISYHETLSDSPSKYVEFHRFVSDTNPTLGYLINEQTIVKNGKGIYAGVE